jgi:hypothetical protein
MVSAANQSDPIPASVATPAQYRDALLKIQAQLSENMRAMLQFQYRAPGRTASAAELAKCVGYATFRPANLQYGKLGRLVAEALNFSPPRRPDGTYRYWSALSTGDPELQEGEDWRFVMRPELAAAISDLRWFEPPNASKIKMAT